MPILSAQLERRDTINSIEPSTSGDPNSGVVSVSNIPLVCLQLGDSLALSDAFDDHRDTIQVGSSEHFASLKGFELPDLSSPYRLKIDITGLGLAGQADAETDTG